MADYVDFYKSVVRYAGMTYDEDGYIYNVTMKGKKPATVKGKHLCLPTQNHTMNMNDQKIIFHPLNEVFTNGVSDIVTSLKTAINIKLNYTVGYICATLLTLVANRAEHSKLSVEQLELMKVIGEVDEKSGKDFLKIMTDNCVDKSDNLYCNIFLKIDGVLPDGTRTNRLGVFSKSVPYDKEFVKGASKIRSRNINDVVNFKNIFEFVLPGGDSEYNATGTRATSTFIEALLCTSLNVSCKLNYVYNLFRDYMDEELNLEFDHSVTEYIYNAELMEKIVTMARTLPVQDGNQGSGSGPVNQPATNLNQVINTLPKTNTPATVYAQPNQPNAANNQQPAPLQGWNVTQPVMAMPNQPAAQVNTNGTVSLNSLPVPGFMNPYGGQNAIMVAAMSNYNQEMAIAQARMAEANKRQMENQMTMANNPQMMHAMMMQQNPMLMNQQMMPGMMPGYPAPNQMYPQQMPQPVPWM